MPKARMVVNGTAVMWHDVLATVIWHRPEDNEVVVIFTNSNLTELISGDEDVEIVERDEISYPESECADCQGSEHCPFAECPEVP